MSDSHAHKALTNRLAEELGSASAQSLATRLTQVTGDAKGIAAVAALLDELAEVSGKAARAAIEALPELDRRAGLAQVAA